MSNYLPGNVARYETEEEVRRRKLWEQQLAQIQGGAGSPLMQMLAASTGPTRITGGQGRSADETAQKLRAMGVRPAGEEQEMLQLAVGAQIPVLDPLMRGLRTPRRRG